jgi:hypothetical protein
VPAPFVCSLPACSRPATIVDDGKVYCGMHAPDPPNVVAAKKREQVGEELS